MSSIKFDANNRPSIELSNGERIQFNGVASEEYRVQRGESVELVQQQCQQVISRCKESGYDMSNLRNLVMATLRYFQYDVTKAANAIIHNGDTFRKHKFIRSFDQLRHVFEAGLVWYLPGRNRDGSVGIVIESGKNWNPSKIPLLDLWEASRLAVELALNDEMVQFSGFKMIVDCHGAGWDHFRAYSSKSAQIVLKLQRCRVFQITCHFVENARLLSVGHSLLAPLLGNDFKQNCFFHGTDWSSLHQHVSPDCLISKYGGTAPDYDHTLVGELIDKMKHTLPVFKPWKSDEM
ncbi:clavesin-1-like [Malaya genurostris]|uniref:clavesin-1-like n=1 Tax=Malaya genurostris TaxID=325434 RepID=UPI0026F3D36F|nr:clavesin-1-like [Malaya genurostris]